MDLGVLVVDDDAATRALLIRVMKTLGVERVVEAVDGDEAIARADEAEFDLVLLDWEMPGQKGPEVIRALRERNDHAQVVMISAEAQKSRVLRAVEAGAAGYIVKPFEVASVREKLKSLCQSIVAHRRTADYRIGSIMTTDVVTIREDAPVREAIKTLLEHRISGLPVVDAEGQLVGIITEYQLVQALFRPDVSDEPVGRFMTTELVTVGEDALLFQVANLLIKHRMRRVPVVRDGRVVGIIARRDLLRYMLGHEAELNAFLESLRAAHPAPVAVTV
ncbi:MAG: CBS domain-containing protein [Pirellulales bacterium]|nr:CBS domain-containing protein [Pirellulales bacterium]